MPVSIIIKIVFKSDKHIINTLRTCALLHFFIYEQKLFTLKNIWDSPVRRLYVCVFKSWYGTVWISDPQVVMPFDFSSSNE